MPCFDSPTDKQKKTSLWAANDSSHPILRANWTSVLLRMGALEMPLCKHLACLNYLIFVHSAFCNTSVSIAFASVFFFFFFSFPLWPSSCFVKLGETNLQLEAELEHCCREICGVSAYVSRKWGNHYNLSNCHRDLHHMARPLWFNSFTWYLEAIYLQQLAVKQTTSATVVQVATLTTTLVCQPANRHP